MIKMTDAQFNEWMTDRFNEYSRAGIDKDHRAINEFISDFRERFPNGVQVTE